MRVLIIGASGYIGGRLIQHLLAAGTEVRAAGRTARAWPDGVEARVTDIHDAATLLDACAKVDAAINLASMNERACASDPQAALQVNAGGTRAWAAAAAEAGVARFVQVSTVKVYGSSLTGVVTEETPCRPLSDYGITNRMAEDYASALHPNSVVIRLSNGFGAPATLGLDCWQLVVNDFCRQAAVSQQVVIRSSGLAWRNFIPVSDVVRALEMAAHRLPPGTYNMGARRSMRLRDAAELVAHVCDDTLGFRPALDWASASPGEHCAPLDYRIDRIVAAGVQTCTPFDEEIQAALLAAHKEFLAD